MIEVSHLTKIYSTQTAVKDISFQVKEGEIVGFLGPNGAGKSTVMNIITGYLSATSGSAKIGGHDILQEPISAKKLIGYLPERPPLYYDMTVKEYLDFMFDLKKVKLPKRDHITEVCDSVKITDMKDRMIKNLSKGYRQRVGIAQAMLGNPKVLILDEPTVGLDPNQILEIRNLIKRLSEKHTVILSSHILSEVQAVCERVIIINYGSIIADGRLDELSKNLSKNHDITLKVKGDEKEILKILEDTENVESVLLGGLKEKADIYEYTLKLKDKNKDIRENIFNNLATKSAPIYEMTSKQLTLEELFVGLTTGEIMPEANLVIRDVLDEKKESK